MGIEDTLRKRLTTEYCLRLNVPMKKTTSILFLGKQADLHCLKALNFLQSHFSNVDAYLGKWGDPLPDLNTWHGDYIISYLSKWIVPHELIKKSRIAAINFHPASPDYPGIGCNNFALYDNAPHYGATCHHMSKTVDTGDIIATKKFPLLPTDTVETLLSRTYDFQLVLFYEMMTYLLDNQALPRSNLKWRRKPFTRKEFNQLTIIDLNMSTDEIHKRIRATHYREFKPFIEIGEHKFALVD